MRFFLLMQIVGFLCDTRVKGSKVQQFKYNRYSSRSNLDNIMVSCKNRMHLTFNKTQKPPWQSVLNWTHPAYTLQKEKKKLYSGAACITVIYINQPLHYLSHNYEKNQWQQQTSNSEHIKRPHMNTDFPNFDTAYFQDSHTEHARLIQL